MIEVNGEQFPTHKEYHDKYPHAKHINKRKNTVLLMAANSIPCADCGLHWHPAVMTQDHIERNGYKTSTGKRKFPADMLGYPTELYAKELAKCESVCRNCHHLREMRRDGILNKKKWRIYGDKALLEGQL